MQTVSRNMTEEHIFANATTDEDKLSTTLSFIRAAQNNKLAKMKRKASEYPHIRNLVNIDDPNICHTNGFDLLSDDGYESVHCACGDVLFCASRDGCQG